MKNYYKINLRIFSLVLVSILAITSSCQKNKKISDELEGDTFPVRFKIKDFESIVSPLQKSSGIKKLALTKGTNDDEEETLFHWNFDKSNADPLIAFNPLPVIDFNNGKIDYNFSAGWPTTGKSISFRGAQSIVFKLPVQYIKWLSNFSLDVNSSATGPRALLIDYSTDNGLSFSRLSDTLYYPLELSSAGASKLPIVQSLSEIPVLGKDLVWIRIRLYEGTRPVGSIYNPTTGIFKIDNVVVTGVVDKSVVHNKLYYHIYNSENHELVKQGGISAEESFVIDLPVGVYYLSMITKNSNSPLTFANVANRNGFYINNSFKEKETEIYATRDTIEVTQSTERSLIFNRIYSEIKVEFTDVEDLSAVDSIQIQQKHPSFHYYPFSNTSNTAFDATILKIETNFTADDKSFFFNQFMGFYDTNKAIKYELKVFKNGAIIRTFELDSEVKNNMQVLFKGLLLEGADPGQGFIIRKNEQWNGKVDIEF